jgi:hypothetical protein
LLDYLTSTPTLSTTNRALRDDTSNTGPQTPTLTPLPPYASNAHYSAPKISGLLRALEKFKLTKAELIMMVNLRPTELGLLDAVVEELDERFDEGQQKEICALVGRWLGGGVGGSGHEEDGDGMR